MPKKRRRKRLNWGPILILLLAANTAAGLGYSKLTSIVRVQVRGVPEWDRARVGEILQNARNKPALAMNPRIVETAVQGLPEVEMADLSRNVFGRAVLKVQYHEPVARIAGPRPVGMTAEGVTYDAQTLPKGLPLVKLPKDASEPMAGFIGNWQAGDVANVCDQVRDLALNRTVVVVLTLQGGLCLNIDAGGQVLLGQPTELDAKLALLRQMLQQNPAFLDQLEYLDLKAPERPQQKLKEQVRQN
jgi:cell division septal protein FtsQ